MQRNTAYKQPNVTAAQQNIKYSHNTDAYKWSQQEIQIRFAVNSPFLAGIIRAFPEFRKRKRVNSLYVYYYSDECVNYLKKNHSDKDYFAKEEPPSYRKLTDEEIAKRKKARECTKKSVATALSNIGINYSGVA